MKGCFENNVDLAIARNIRLGGSRQLQFRVDIFNAFNTVVYTGRVNTSPAEQPDGSDGSESAVQSRMAASSRPEHGRRTLDSVR